MRKWLQQLNRKQTVFICFFLFFQSTQTNAQSLCADQLIKASLTRPRSEQEAWNQSVEAVKQINHHIYKSGQAIEAIVASILAKEFLWINGDGGSGKTRLSRLVFRFVLNSIPEQEKEIFILQFHKLVSEGKIIGFPKFNSMMKDGKYEIETKSSLVGNKYLFLIADEAEKSNPAVLNALLSVLNERKAFLGAQVVEAILMSGALTSNKTIGEFIQGYKKDRASGEAVMDRTGIKLHMVNQQNSARETVEMNDLTENEESWNTVLPLLDLHSMIEKIKLSDQMIYEIVLLTRELDRYVTHKADKSREAVRYGEAESEYFPANQFSTRSMRRLISIFKATFLARQLMEGRPFKDIRFEPKREDLYLLAKGALYIGPSEIRLKSFPLLDPPIQVKSPYGVLSELAAFYSPFDNRVFLKKDDALTVQFTLHKSAQGWRLESTAADFEGWTVDAKDLSALQARTQEFLKKENLKLDTPQFEVDRHTDILLARGTFEEPTRLELKSIRDDLEQFANILNQHFERPIARFSTSRQKRIPERTDLEIRNFRRELRNLSPEKRTASIYDWMTYEIRGLNQRFIELDYAIESKLTAMLSDNHVYAFSPPGAAKTALAEALQQSELRFMNAEQIDLFVQKVLASLGKDESFLSAVLLRLRHDGPQVYDRFMLQFHKLLPEGLLIGFAKIDKLLNDGIEEIEVSTSLASQKFVFAILDEIDKANPQTFAALLSILQEREVLAGNQVLRTGLRTAILTSNKMPSEILDSFEDDRSTGIVAMDRIVNLVYFSNKISSDEALTNFLIGIENGHTPAWRGFMGISHLKSVVKKVEFENPALKELLAEIFAKYLARRMKRSEETRRLHREDPRAYPDYYVMAAITASNRTFVKLLNQLKSRFIVHQLVHGVPFNELRTKIEMKDLGLFFEGLGYWAPQTIQPFHTPDGILQFKNNSEILERSILSGTLTSRVKYQTSMMVEEAKDFVQVINAIVGPFLQEYRDEINRYPELFQNQENLATATFLRPPSLNEPLSPAQVELTISSLARLRISVDEAKTQAYDSAGANILSPKFFEAKLKKFQEECELQNIMTRTQFLDRIKQEVLRIQTETRLQKLREDAEEEEERARQQLDDELSELDTEEPDEESSPTPTRNGLKEYLNDYDGMNIELSRFLLRHMRILQHENL